MSKQISMTIDRNKAIQLGIQKGSGGGGTNNYDMLLNRPSINGVVLTGNKTSSEIKVQDPIGDITPQDIDNLIFG